jgi:C1A family cysteine protease
MNKKRNTIFAIIITIIIIGVFIFASVYSINKTPTRADLINEQLRAQNASWVAKDYSDEILNIPLGYEFPEYNTNDKQIFNIDNVNEFFPENQNTDDINSQKKEKTGNTGFFLLTDAVISPMVYEYNDEINWKEYITPGKEQISCGSCKAFSILGAMEGYINRKLNYTGSKRINLSEQYLISYSSFMGCGGEISMYYINLLTLAGYSPQNINNYFKEKINTELNNSNKLNSKRELITKTQLSLAVGEVPLGVPLEEQLKYVSYDSCEIIKLEKSKTPKSGMNISPISELFTSSEINSKLCPDGSDNDSLDSPVRYKYTVPKKQENLTKYFIENYIEIENTDCKKKNSKTVKNIKEALKHTPVAISMAFYDSMMNTGHGVWEKLNSDDKTKPMGHALFLVGWGTEKIRNKEYWIIKNSFGDHWGDGGYFRVWIGDQDTEFECREMFGFSGNVITKSGNEINELLPAVINKRKQDKLEQEEREKSLQKQQDKVDAYQEIQNNNPSYTPIIPEIGTDLLNDYFQKNISYSDIESITNSDCLTITACLYNKLNNFFEITETPDNRLT